MSEVYNSSLSSRRAWIEINKTFKELFEYIVSLSSRRAWIEILWLSSHLALDKSRSPHGERGLKLLLVEATSERAGRSPHGERGLKCVAICGRCKAYRSLSSRRAWIEIFCLILLQSFFCTVALLTESVD